MWWNGGECRAPGLPETEPEVEETELLSSGAEPSVGEEIEDLDGAYEQLELIKQRLLQLREILLPPQKDKCYQQQEEQEREDTSFKTQESLQLIELRRQNCQMRCKLATSYEHLNSTRKQIKELEGWRCLLQSRILDMSKQVTQFEEFKIRAIHHFALCIERWEQQKTTKVDHVTYRNRMQKVVYHADNCRQVLVPLHCHMAAREHVRMELMLLRAFLHNLLEAMVSDFRFFCRQMSVRWVSLGIYQ
ncbi:hypothetical protein KR026_007744 [Drosophila bipectinata]|nr:hypothetical protein KR026_007744 [Drosophila bipectinata]